MGSQCPLCQKQKHPSGTSFQRWYDFFRLYIVGVFELLRQWSWNLFQSCYDTGGLLRGFRTVNPVILITGATSGIGQQLLFKFIRNGADVIALTHQLDNTGVPSGCVTVRADFNCRVSTEQAATKVESILNASYAGKKVVIFQCAGVYSPQQFGTRNGPGDPVTQTLNINLLMPCLLVQRLSQRLSGIVWLGSSAQNATPYLTHASCLLDTATTPYSMYPLSKLLNVVYAEQWATSHNKPAVVIHPGVVATRLYNTERGFVGIILRALMPLCAWSATHSARRVLQLLQSVSFWERIQIGAPMTRRSRYTGIYYDAVSMAEAALPSHVQNQAFRACVVAKLLNVIDELPR